MPISRAESTLKLKVILHLLFLFSGTATVLIGQLLPLLARQYSLNDLQLSLYFPFQFTGSLFGTYLTGVFARRNQFLAASFVGSLLMALGLLMMNADSFPLSLAAFAVNGVGIGLTLPAINMTVLELSPGNSASALTFLNFFWGVGAIACKPFVDHSSTGTDVWLTTIILAVLILFCAALLHFQPIRDIFLPPSGLRDQPETPIWRMPLAWAIALFNFVHVGFESGMAGWLTSYTDRLGASHFTDWLSPTLAYFLCFVIGRGLAPLLFRFLNENNMLMLGLILILIGMITTVTASTPFVLGIGAAIAGFGTSWIFPANVARFSNTFGATATRRATPLFVAGTLGAASSTWLIGFVSNQTGDLRSGMYVLVVSVVLLIALQAGLAVRTRRIAEAA